MNDAPFLEDHSRNKAYYDRYAQAYEKEGKGRTISYGEATDEVVFDCIGSLFADGNGLKKFTEWANDTHNIEDEKIAYFAQTAR